MKLYGAIDLHSNNNVTVLIDEQDQVVYQKRLPLMNCADEQIDPLERTISERIKLRAEFCFPKTVPGTGRFWR